MLEWVTEHLDLDSGPQAWDELLIGATEHFFSKTAVALPDCPETAAAEMRIAPRRNPQLNSTVPCRINTGRQSSRLARTRWHGSCRRSIRP